VSERHSDNFLGLEMAAEFDPASLVTHAEMDASPMDWEYWQRLLADDERQLNFVRTR